MTTVLNMTKEHLDAEPDAKPEPWVDLDQAAEHLGFSRNKVAQLADDGVIPSQSFRTGRRVYRRFKLSLIDQWLMSKGA